MPVLRFREFECEVCGFIWESVNYGEKSIGVLYSHGNPVGFYVLKCPSCRAPYWTGPPKDELV